MGGRMRTVLVVCGLLIALPGPVFAANTPGYGPGRKLGRGLANAAFGVFEIPLRIHGAYRDAGFAAAVTWGVVNGAKWALVRTADGVFEVVTFPFPGRGGDYSPLIDPEFPLNPNDPVLWP